MGFKQDVLVRKAQVGSQTSLLSCTPKLIPMAAKKKCNLEAYVSKISQLEEEQLEEFLELSRKRAKNHKRKKAIALAELLAGLSARALAEN